MRRALCRVESSASMDSPDPVNRSFSFERHTDTHAHTRLDTRTHWHCDGETRARAHTLAARWCRPFEGGTRDGANVTEAPSLPGTLGRNSRRELGSGCCAQYGSLQRSSCRRMRNLKPEFRRSWNPRSPALWLPVTCQRPSTEGLQNGIAGYFISVN